jgi:hypothetical protein
MKREIRESLPTWYENINPEEYYLVLSDDMDSLLSSALLCRRFEGLKIGAFFNFQILAENKEITEGKKPIFVDVDLFEGMCFGNHPTVSVNSMAINLNKEIGSESYHEKYAGSVFMMLLSLYNIDLKGFTDEQLLFSLSVDSAMKGYYVPKFKRQWLYWFINVLQLRELKELVTTYQEKAFHRISFKYDAKSKILLDDETFKLYTDIDIEGINEDLAFDIQLPDTTFNHISAKFTKHKSDYSNIKSLVDYFNLKMFSNARTYENTLKYSYQRSEEISKVEKFLALIKGMR